MSSESLRIFAKFLSLSFIIPLFRYANFSFSTHVPYFLSCLCVSYVYLGEHLIPFLPKLTYGEVSSGGILGMLVLASVLSFPKIDTRFFIVSFLAPAIVFLKDLHDFFRVIPVFAFYVFCLFGIFMVITTKSIGSVWCYSLLLASLVGTLKRGPLLGVITALIYHFFEKNSLKKIVYLALAFLGIVFLIPDLRVRFAEAITLSKVAHDQRFLMWKAGVNIALENPLGVGYGKADILREKLPEEFSAYKHFHSNYVNILVENGFIGLVAFIAFLVTAFIKSSPQIRMLVIYFAITGCFESNYIDSEYIINLFLLISILGKNSLYPLQHTKGMY
ncbi:MAG: O-antigen ligase family protein [Deltaproteobacteria bacterium]|nr:O-antigen ligase family protein [Deltaproteobacteria bacterium]